MKENNGKNTLYRPIKLHIYNRIKTPNSLENLINSNNKIALLPTNSVWETKSESDLSYLVKLVTFQKG